MYHTTQTHPSRQNARQKFSHQLRRLSHHPFTGLYRFCGPTPSPPPQIRTPLPLLVNATAEQFDASVTLLSPPVGCVTHPTYQNDTNGARSGLNAWCNAGNVVRGTNAEFLSYTSAIAYICNYSGSTNRCSSAEFDVANQLMNADCGGSSAARVKIGAWAKGYRRDNKSGQICTWGLGAGRDRNPGDPFLFV